MYAEWYFFVFFHDLWNFGIWEKLENGLTCFENTAMSSLKDSEEQTSPPATPGSLGVHVASSHFSKMRASRGNKGCLSKKNNIFRIESRRAAAALEASWELEKKRRKNLLEIHFYTRLRIFFLVWIGLYLISAWCGSDFIWYLPGVNQTLFNMSPGVNRTLFDIFLWRETFREKRLLIKFVVYQSGCIEDRSRPSRDPRRPIKKIKAVITPVQVWPSLSRLSMTRKLSIMARHK